MTGIHESDLDKATEAVEHALNAIERLLNSRYLRPIDRARIEQIVGCLTLIQNALAEPKTGTAIDSTVEE